MRPTGHRADERGGYAVSTRHTRPRLNLGELSSPAPSGPVQTRGASWGDPDGGVVGGVDGVVAWCHGLLWLER